MEKIMIYKGTISEVIEQIKKDIKNETTENKDMVDDQKHWKRIHVYEIFRNRIRKR